MFIPEQLRRIGFNKRVLTIDDFYSLADTERIITLRTHEPSLPNGCYFHHLNYPVIWLEEKLSEFDLLFTAWHEMAHHLLHPPELRFFSRGTITKIDTQADTLSAVCVLPLPDLKKILRGQKESDHLPRSFVTTRNEIFIRCGI